MTRLAVLALLCLGCFAATGTASAGPALSVKSVGKWYWSVDLTDGVFSLPGDPLSHLPAQASTGKATKNLGLTGDQLRMLSSRFIAAKVMAGPWEPSPAFNDGTVVFSHDCRGIGMSIPSGFIDIDLYHQFRCTVTGATFRRYAQFEAAIAAARAKLIAAPQPKPQALVNALAVAYERLGAYQRRGEPVSRTVTLEVTGRRDVTNHVGSP